VFRALRRGVKLYAFGKNLFFQEMIMMMRYVAVTLTALALLGGCQKKEDPSEAGPAERAGRKIDQATEQAGQKLDQAGHKLDNAAQQASQQLSEAAKETSQQLDKAADKAGETLNSATKEAGRKLERAGEKMQTAADEREAKK
jgi:biopolymer transport protein ExbB/TolQ